VAVFGTAALIVTFALAVYATGAALLAARRRDRRLMQSAANALMAGFATTLAATACLLIALARHDFSIQTVATTTSRELPLQYRLSALWAS
jgi:cytochrome c-type biogenesis protein CcmF